MQSFIKYTLALCIFIFTNLVKAQVDVEQLKKDIRNEIYFIEVDLVPNPQLLGKIAVRWIEKNKPKK